MLILAWVIDMLLRKLTPQIGIEFEIALHTMPQGLRIHATSAFFFNIFSIDLHFDTIIIGLCLICLVMGQTHGESTL